MCNRVTSFVVIVCILGFGITAQAQLLVPPIDNPSFEAQDLGEGGAGQWADYAEEWIINVQGNCYLEDGSWEIAAPDGVATLKMWGGAAIWQQIGFLSPNKDYEIGLWVGRGVDNSDIEVELWAGGNPAFVPDSGFGTIDSAVGASLIVEAPLVPTVPVGENEWMSITLNTGAGFESGDALWLRVESTGDAVWVDNVTVTALIDPALAYNPTPLDGSPDVLRDVVASWIPGMYAQKHDVYFGTNADDVTNATRTNPLDVLVMEGQDANDYDLGRLEFGQTYFWRVDEVNSPPDSTRYTGKLWSFTVEPYSIQIPGDSIDVTASSTSNEYSLPEKTINGSGLDANDMHAIAPETMWFSATPDLDPWIQYEFPEVQNLETMKVWNSNGASETAIGWGVKDVEILYSVDGENWDVLPDANQFSQAPGNHTYDQPDEIYFGGVPARYVRLNILSNWGGILMSYGLSEVQFYMIPEQARTPIPASGSAGISPDSVATWRAGRRAALHTIYLSTDANDVANGLAPSITSTTNQVDLSTLDLQLEQTYYWRVDEVNESEATPVWAGPVWSFTTTDALVVDDFESYNDIPVDEAGSNRVYSTWDDGYANPSLGGSTMGYLNAPFLESQNIHGGQKSAPLFYDNTTASLSEVTANTNDLAIGSDWSIGSPQTLIIWLRGDADNDPATDRMYVKIGSAKVTYEGDISLSQWSPWPIELPDLGINLNNVPTLTIGFERLGGSGGDGVMFLDDIMLRGTPPTIPKQPDPEDNLTTNPSLELPDWGPAGTEQWADYVDDWIINTQGTSYLEDGTWQIVAPVGVATLKMWNGAAIWQQIGNVTPNTDYDVSLFVGRGYDASAVRVELWAGGDPAALPTSYGIIGDTVGATLIGGGDLTPTIAVGQSELMGLTINTGPDFGAQDALWIRIQSTGGDGTAAWVDNVMVAKP